MTVQLAMDWIWITGHTIDGTGERDKIYSFFVARDPVKGDSFSEYTVNETQNGKWRYNIAIHAGKYGHMADYSSKREYDTQEEAQEAALNDKCEGWPS